MSATPNSPRRRAALARRDGAACHYCGRGALKNDEWFTLDHVIPRSQGGRNVLANLVLACDGCNQRRGAERYSIFAEINGVARDIVKVVLERALGVGLRDPVGRYTGYVAPKCPSYLAYGGDAMHHLQVARDDKRTVPAPQRGRHRQSNP